ncbi:MAG: type II and III secretion system protein [Verrucomicrobiaceae bacterium]|nr:type II and III secretion system protein [Verrucomicrobiaceae bacterium]
MAIGKRPEADELIAKLLAASPNDKQVLSCRARFADPDRYPPALTSEHVDNVRKVEALLLKANSALEIGDYDLSIRLYQDVLRIDKYNNAARRGMERVEQLKRRYFQSGYDQTRASMLAKVDRLWEDAVPPSSTDLNALFGARERASAASLEGRESILDKLRTYRMPSIEFQGATVPEVIELLRLRSRDLDPEGRGIDFVLNIPDDLKSAQISLSLKDIPMEEVLRYVTEAASVSYRVEPRAVVLTSLGEKNSAMVTRSYRVPPDFIQNSATNAAAPAPGADPFAQAGAATPGGGLSIRRMGAKEFLEGRGILFPEGSSASFSSSTSTLVVRNTIPNVELVESLVEEAMKSAPKMVTVTVRILEVAQNNLDELGFDWLMGGGGSNPKVDFGGGTVGNSARTDLRAGSPFVNAATVPSFSGLPNTTAVTSTGVNPLTAGLRSGQSGNGRLDNLLNTGTALPNQLPAPGILSVAGVFTDPQFQTILRGVSQKKGVDIQATPSVTTKNGQKATVEMQREVIYPTEFDPPQLPQANNTGSASGFILPTLPPIATPTTPTAFEMRKTGVVLEVEPVIGEDGSVELNLTPELTDFEGFVNYGSPISRSGSGVFPITINSRTIGFLNQPDQLITPNQILQPIFKTTKTSTSVRVWDGSTIMLGGLKRQDISIIDDKVPVLGDLPFVGRLFRTHAKQTETKNVVIFVTVDVIDPSGQKIRKPQAAAVAP